MFTLPVKIRGKKESVSGLRARGELVGVLYGPKIKNQVLKLNYRAFEEACREAGYSSLIALEVQGPEGEQAAYPGSRANLTMGRSGAGKKVPVLIHEIQKDPLTGKFLHVDFYQPNLEEKTEARIPLVFDGVSPAVKDLEGTLIKYIQELEIKALPQDLPKEIRVNVEILKTFNDNILIKDLKLPPGVEVLKKPEEIVVSVSPPEKIEEELEKPVEEKVEKVEKAEERGEKEERGEEEKAGEEEKPEAKG